MGIWEGALGQPNKTHWSTLDCRRLCAFQCHQIIFIKLRGAPGVVWPSPIMAVTCAGSEACRFEHRLGVQQRKHISSFYGANRGWHSVCVWGTSREFHDFFLEFQNMSPILPSKVGSVMEQSTPGRKTLLAYLFVRLMITLWASVIPLDSYRGECVKIPKLLGNYRAERRRVKVVVHKQGPSVLLPGDSMSSVCSCCICVSRRPEQNECSQCSLWDFLLLLIFCPYI